MSQFIVYEKAKDAMRQLAPLMPGVKRADKKLDDQIRRAAASVMLNIAEGRSALGGNERSHFRIALGSAREVSAALEFAALFGYIDDGVAEDVDATLDEVKAMLYKLSR